jgi:hypothetical protein
MEDGEIIECGPTEAMLAGAQHESVRALMAMPRRQAERVGALARGAAS